MFNKKMTFFNPITLISFFYWMLKSNKTLKYNQIRW